MWTQPPFTNKLGVIDIRSSYQKLSLEFCQYYYRLCDTNFPSVGDLYANSACITYFNSNFGNFDAYLNYVKNIHGIYKFDHHSVQMVSQPLDDNSVLINTTGSITANGSVYFRKFMEIIVLKRDMWGKYYVTNSVFKLTD